MPIVETGDIQTHYEEEGDGPPVVFIHGAMSDRQLWTPVIQRLSDTYHCIRYDVRGHGRTGGSDRASYPFDLYASDLDALLDKLELEEPVLCGLSMGGMIAATYAANYDRPLRAVVISGAPTPNLSGRSEWIGRLIMPKLFLPVVKLIGYQRVMSAIQAIQLKLFGEDAVGDMEKIEALREEDTEMSTDEVVKLFGALRSYYTESLPLEEIEAPMLALAGEREPDMMAHHFDVFASRVPGIQTDRIPAAGHNAHVDNPEWFAQRVRTFIAAQRAGTSTQTDSGSLHNEVA